MKNLLKDRLAVPFVLASKSPRRADLLAQIGLTFEIKPSNIREELVSESDPEKHVRILSTLKAKAVAKEIAEGIVVGADTIVVLDGQILGKPVDEKHAFEMLSLLSGKTHQVYTGFCLIQMPGGRVWSDTEKTHVHFRHLADQEIWTYIKTGQPMDKAGAYGIQDLSAVFVDRIEGCYFNVVGFPLAKFYQSLISFLHLM